jgi:hypothetical protein
MIKKIILGSIMLSTMGLFAQTEPQHETNFELGSGLNFSLNEGNYQFKLGGMIQPNLAFEQLEDQDADYFMNSRRTYFNFSGKAVQEKVSFFFQLDYSLSSPLLDAWIGWHPTDQFNIYFGQKQTLGNNREMMVMENYLQFPGRSILSTSFSESGREFGLFMDYTLGTEAWAVVPQIAVTSGDGRNSFGVDSRDVDLGGLKYAARLDVYPLGMFSEGNDQSMADLAHEESPKILLGAAASFNDGASGAVGESHGDFFLYNQEGDNQLPDYRQLYADLLVKYKGFSLLGEYNISTATNLEGSFLDVTASTELDPTQISEYLALGTGMNVQLGYVTESGYALDLRYAMTTPEFEENLNSVLAEQTAATVGLSKYFKGNALKLQLAVSSIETTVGDQSTNLVRGEVLMSLVF